MKIKFTKNEIINLHKLLHDVSLDENYIYYKDINEVENKLIRIIDSNYQIEEDKEKTNKIHVFKPIITNSHDYRMSNELFHLLLATDFLYHEDTNYLLYTALYDDCILLAGAMNMINALELRAELYELNKKLKELYEQDIKILAFNKDDNDDN